MKKIVTFKIISNEGNITIDAFNPIFQAGLETGLDQLLSYTHLYKNIFVKNFTSIPQSLITRLTNQYLHGAEIIFETPKKNFAKLYKCPRPRKLYSYQWTELDLSKPIPKSLAVFEFDYHGHKISYLNAIKSLTSTKYLPNEIWTALDKYSAQQIAKCKEYNQGDYDFAESWYKSLMKDCFKSNIKCKSPNRKTYFEVIAELDFENSIPQLEDGEEPLNDEELNFLFKNAQPYGVEIPQLKWRINTRKTDHGYTEEPERVLSGLTQSDYDRICFNPKGDNLPKTMRQNLMVKTCDNPKLLKDAFTSLKWLVENLGDEALLPEYHRCPVCHEIYHENRGCECGYCKSIEFLQADNLFYGNEASYEDIDAMHELYSDILSEQD